MTRRRPLGVPFAVAFLAVAGLAGLMVGPYLVVLGVWLAQDVAGDAALMVLATESIAGIGAFCVGVAAFATARALWRGQAWAWPAAMALGVALLAGMALIALLDVWTAPYVLVVGLAALLVGSLLPASVRSAYGL